MILKTTKTIFFLFIVLFSLSCENNNAVEIPAYILIDSIELKTNQSIQGAPSHNITDIWVYENNVPIGVFATKQLIPILPNNYSDMNIKLFPGIRINGIKQDINNYFLLNEMEVHITGSPGEIDTLNAVFKYADHANFVFVEGFENNNIFSEDLDDDDNTKITFTNKNPKSGNYSGKITLTKDNPKFKAACFLDYELPTDGKNIFLELDYRGNTGFIVGISGKEASGSQSEIEFIYIKESDKWNKIYLDLTDDIKFSKLETYKIYFLAIHNDNNNISTIFLDNIKLLYSGI